MSRELKSPVTGTAAAVALVAAIPLLMLACATGSVETTVTRAPKLPVFKSRQIGLAPIEVTGSTRFETEFACGGKASGELGNIPDARRSHYAEGLQTLVRGVLEAGGVQVVGVGEAPQTLKLAATVFEVQSTIFKRCDQETSVEGLECLPDPEIDGKTQCGCVAVTEGSLSPDGYHFVVRAEGNLRIEARTRLELAEGGLIGEDTIHLFAPPAFNGGSIPCNHVRGQPERLERCLNAGVTLSSGPVLQEVNPDFEAAFRTVFASATARENGGKSVYEAMFPFEVRVRYTIFKLKEPRSVTKPAVRALRSGRFDEAAVLFEGALASVREGKNLSPVARARFIYDYGLSLLGAGKLREAKAAIEEAKAIQQDARFDAALAEIDRQGMDGGALGTAVADAAGVNPTATPGAPSAPAGGKVLP